MIAILGFTYCGTHSAKFGCYYVPTALDQGRDMPAYTVEELDVEGRDGGYYIGNRVKPRDFSLDCYVEDITEATREGLLRWLDRNTVGQLVFDHKPYVYYDVRPVKQVEIRQYMNRSTNGKIFSGTFTIVFRCYDPFGKLFRNAYTNMPDSVELIATGILPVHMMPPAPSTQDRQLLRYNCGTERAHTVIRLAGDVGDGLMIENMTTGQQCKISGLKADEIPPGAYLEIQSETGQVWLVKGAERELAFHYHDLGYIMLAPCTPFVRDIRVSYTEGSKELISDGMFERHMAGQYAYLNGGWRLIHWVDNTNVAHTDWPMKATGTETTSVVTMNNISINGDGMALTRLDMLYIPRVH